MCALSSCWQMSPYRLPMEDGTNAAQRALQRKPAEVYLGMSCGWMLNRDHAADASAIRLKLRLSLCDMKRWATFAASDKSESGLEGP